MKLCLHRRGHLWEGGKPLTEEQQKIVTDNLGLAYHLAQKKPIPGMDRDDNESEALFCLTRAALNFRPELGFKFTTFFWRVWVNHRKDGVRESQMEVRGYFAPKCRLGQENMGHMEPMDLSESPYETLEHREEIDSMRAVFKLLDPRSRLIMRLRADGQSLAEIGEALGTTRERIRQIVARSIYQIQLVHGLEIDLVNQAIRELHEIHLAQMESQKKYQAKIRSIREIRKANPNWSAKTIAKHLKCSEQMVRNHGKYQLRPKKVTA